MSARRLKHYKLLRGRRDIVNITVSSESEEYYALILMINTPDLFSTDVLDLKETRYKRVSLCLMKVLYKWKINDQLVKKEDQRCIKTFQQIKLGVAVSQEVSWRSDLGIPDSIQPVPVLQTLKTFPLSC